jgi:hypothetical protein
MNLFEELIGADLGKELKRVVNTVGAGVFLKVLGGSTKVCKDTKKAGAEALT